MLEYQRFIIKEHVAVLKMSDTYDIFNADNQMQLGTAKEVNPGWVTTLRFLVSKRALPTNVEVRESPDDSLVFRIRRGFSFLRPRVEVLDAQDQLMGYFKAKLFSIGGGFWVYDPQDQPFAEVKGNWIGWNFTFKTPDGVQLGEVSKQWAGLGKELFTSADTYIVSISDELSGQPLAKMLLLAAALAIDVVYKEK